MSALPWRDYIEYRDTIGVFSDELRDSLEWDGNPDDKKILKQARKLRSLLTRLTDALTDGMEE